jgi:murein DD-endopeptidase MepM/ murein hydrolase activator NlpD
MPMFGGLLLRIRAKLRATFVAREVILRSEGRVRYLRLSTRTQVIAASVMTTIVVGAMATSIGMVIQRITIHGQQVAVRQADNAYTRLLTEVTGYFDQFTQSADAVSPDEAALLGLTKSESAARQRLAAADSPGIWSVFSGADPEDREALRNTLRIALQEKLTSFDGDLKRIAERNQFLSTRVIEMQAEAEQLGGARDSVMRARDSLARQLAAQQDQNSSLSGQVKDLSGQVAGLDQRLDFQTGKSKSLTAEVADLQQKLGQTEADNTDLAQQVEQNQRALATVVMQRNLLQAARTDMAGTVEDLQLRLASLQESQSNFVSHLTQRTRQNLEDMEKTVQMTGLNVDQLLHLTTEQGQDQGGPFIPAPTDTKDANERKLLQNVANLDDEVGRWEKLQVILRSMPLSAPVDHYYISSGFGERIDPFNGEGAIHEGLDMVDAIHSDILATAPGKVVYAGWRGGYGRCVEIDHGLGIHTIYAHLDSILVKDGDLVDYRQAIGKLGTSGRSNGPHVHYEVRFEGKALDPMGFLKAGRYVFKG